MTRPLVLIPAYRLARDRVARWDDAAVAAPDRYARALTRAGATPVLLPPAGDEAPVDRLGAFDALMLIGGGDVNPSRYGGADHAKQYGVDDERDASEIALLREAVSYVRMSGSRTCARPFGSGCRSSRSAAARRW